MKTIDLTCGSPSLPALLDMASEDSVILRTQDGREYILAAIDEFDRRSRT